MRLGRECTNTPKGDIRQKTEEKDTGRSPHVDARKPEYGRSRADIWTDTSGHMDRHERAYGRSNARIFPRTRCGMHVKMDKMS